MRPFAGSDRSPRIIGASPFVDCGENVCGIFGYVGAPVNVSGVVLTALQSMEYRGYDSWGVAYTLDGKRGEVVKRVGRVAVDALNGAKATSAIGHTRWATHGEVCDRNAHPHTGCEGRLALVHNGIIENAESIRNLLDSSHHVHSDTDSELMVHLVETFFVAGQTLCDSVQAAFDRIEGNNAFVAFDRETEEIVVVTRRLPIRLSDVQGALVLASDPAALAGVAAHTIPVPDGRAVSLGTPGRPSSDVLKLLAESPRLAVAARRLAPQSRPGSSMRSEIEEQPELLLRLADDCSTAQMAASLLSGAGRIVFTGCGSALNAAQFAANILTDANPEVDAVAWPASEVEARSGLVRSTDVFVALSQSGETADVIDALTVARSGGARTIGLINVEGSSAERLADVVVPLRAGHERSVLATKSFVAMLARVWQLVHLATEAGVGARMTLERDAELMSTALADEHVQCWVHLLSAALASRSSAMVVASGGHLPIADEAALKIKEGTYVHAESVRSGELKHGVIALVDAGFPCLAMSSDRDSGGRLGIAAEELRSRGAKVFWCGPNRPVSLASQTDSAALGTGSSFVQTLLVQLVALETALLRGVNPDYPRNLAKSVTVR